MATKKGAKSVKKAVTGDAESELALPAVERTHGSKPFEMTPFVLFLRAQIDKLRPLLTRRVEMRIALHRHTGSPGVMEAAAELLSAVPGIELAESSEDSRNALGMLPKNLVRDTLASL